MSQIPIVLIGFHRYTPYLISKISKNSYAEPRLLIVSSSRSEYEKDPKQLAERYGLSFHAADSLNSTVTKNCIRENKIKLGISLGCYEIIDEELLDIPDYGVIGIHASPLPCGRGQAPVNYQIIFGRDQATVSVFQFTPEIDAGDIFGQETIPIFEDESVGSLYDRLINYGVEIVDESIDKIARGTLQPVPQSIRNATYWPKRYPLDSMIDWYRSACQISRFIRALNDPYPNAFTYFSGQKCEITKAEPFLENESNAKPGEIIEVKNEKILLVQTGSAPLGIQRASVGEAPSLGGGEFSDSLNLQSGDYIGQPQDFPSDFIYTGLRGPQGRKDLKLQTNVPVGTTAENYVYCFAPNKTAEITVEAKNEDQILVQSSKLVQGHELIPIRFTPNTTGQTLIEVEIEEYAPSPRRFVVFSH